MPQWIYEEPYNALSDKAKQIYMFLFDRRTLSIQNKWFDEKGDVFVYFTNEQLMEKLNCSNKPIIQAKKELSDYGLIKEVRQGVNKPNRLYILGSVESTQRKCRKYTSGSVESTLQEVSKVHAINTNNINTEYIKTDNINYKEDEKKSLSQIIKSTSIKINDRQIQQIQEYIGLDNMAVDMIDYAIQLTEDAGAESFNYLNKILKSWKDKGLTSLDEAKAETSGFRESKNVTSKTRFVGNAIEHEYQGELPF
nr:MAG TPA: replisome organizer protein [Caudoviricetes sp.]